MSKAKPTHNGASELSYWKVRMPKGTASLRVCSRRRGQTRTTLTVTGAKYDDEDAIRLFDKKATVLEGPRDLPFGKAGKVVLLLHNAESDDTEAMPLEVEYGVTYS